MNRRGFLAGSGAALLLPSIAKANAIWPGARRRQLAPRSIVGQQWGAKQSTGSAGSAFTYHQTFTVERQAHRFRFKLLNVNTSTMTIDGAAVAVSERLGTGAQRYTPSTGVWVPITWNNGATSVVIAAGSTDRPTIKWSDWINIQTVPMRDATRLPVVMTRFALPTGNFSLGNYNFTPWAATSGFNAGRFMFMFRNIGNFASSNFGGFGGTGYTNPFLLGLEYEITGPSFTFAAQGDSITEGAVNGSVGNFGNGWFWQTMVALRNENPDLVIGYVNNGLSSSQSSTFITRIDDFIAAGCKFDAMIYSAWTPNDGTPDASVISQLTTRLNSALAKIAAQGKQALIWGPCVNTDAAWDATADGLRLDFRDTVLAKEPTIPAVDIESPLSDGATPARFQAALTTDGTHPNEAGYAELVPRFKPKMQALLSR